MEQVVGAMAGEPTGETPSKFVDRLRTLWRMTRPLLTTIILLAGVVGIVILVGDVLHRASQESWLGSPIPRAKPPAVVPDPVRRCVGTEVTPASDLTATVEGAPEGTSFCLAPGLYRLTRPINPKSGTAIWGAPGAVLSGGRVETEFGRSGTQWILTGQTQQFTPLRTLPCSPETSHGCALPEAVFYDDKPLWPVASLGELRSGGFFFDDHADTIYLIDDPSGHKVEVAVVPAAVVGYAGQQNVTVRGLVVEKFAASADNELAAAVKAGRGWVIEDNEIRLNAGSGVAVASGARVHRNWIHDNGKFGFQGGPLDALTVEHNEISFNNRAGFDGADAGGGDLIQSSNVVLRANRVHHNAGLGLRTAFDSIHVVYDANTIEQNAGSGIIHSASADAVIRDNTIRGNGSLFRGRSLFFGSDLYVGNSRNIEISGNTIEAGVHGIGLVDTEQGSSAEGLHEVRNVYVHDNTVKLPDGGASGLVGSRLPAFTSANNRFERNMYYVTHLGVASWRWQRSLSWREWQAQGQDLTGDLQTWFPGSPTGQGS